MVRLPQRPRIYAEKEQTPIADTDVPLLRWWPNPRIENFNYVPEADGHASEDRRPCCFCEISCFLVAIWVAFIQEVLVFHPAPIRVDIGLLLMRHLHQFAEAPLADKR